MTKKERILATQYAEVRRNEKCQNGVKSWHADPTGCKAVKNVLELKKSINTKI
jgi:hypothetical protein